MFSSMSPLMLGVIVILVAVVLYYAWQYIFSPSGQRKAQNDQQARVISQVHVLAQEVERLKQENTTLEQQLENLAFHVQEDRKDAAKLDEKLEPVLKKYNEFFSKYQLEETEMETDNAQNTSDA